ncbi:MAG: GYD domain-containing protein, partial [Burkholderiaceae bacterium]|nr:GYD domain-containing protein [Burkholderiaceae bacterium]
MVTYISLLNFTDQGARSVKDTVKRFESAVKTGQEYGVTFKRGHWTMGQYDLVIEVEAKDEASLAAFTLAMASQGNV